MERYLTVKGVITEILEEHENVIRAKMCSNNKEDFDRLSTEADCIWRTIGKITSLLPETKQKVWVDRLEKHYKGLSLRINFELGGNIS